MIIQKGHIAPNNYMNILDYQFDRSWYEYIEFCRLPSEPGLPPGYLQKLIDSIPHHDFSDLRDRGTL